MRDRKAASGSTQASDIIMNILLPTIHNKNLQVHERFKWKKGRELAEYMY